MLESARRLLMIVLVASIVSGATFGAVALSGASANGRRVNVRQRWSKVEYDRAPGEIALQLVIVAGIAWAGRKVLGLRM